MDRIWAVVCHGIATSLTLFAMTEGLRMRGGSPSPYPLPSRERVSFRQVQDERYGQDVGPRQGMGLPRRCAPRNDRRMGNGIATSLTLFAMTEGFRMRGGFTLTPALSHQGRGCPFDRLRTNGMDRIWAVAGYGIAAWLTGSKKWVIILKTPVSRHECIAHMGR